MDSKRIRKVKRNDAIAKWVITVGGISIILSVIAILVLIAKEVVPLFTQPFPEESIRLAGIEQAESTVYVGADNYLESAFRMDRLGRVAFLSLPDGAVKETIALTPPFDGALIEQVDSAGSRDVAIRWSDGSITLENIRFKPFFNPDRTRTIRQEITRVADFPPVTHSAAVWGSARRSAEGTLTRVAAVSDGTIRILQKTVEEDFMGDVEEEEFSASLHPPEGMVPSVYALDSQGLKLYAGSAAGRLCAWSLQEPGEPELLDCVDVNEPGVNDPVTALGTVFGDESIAVGQASGRYTTWSRVPVIEYQGAKRLRKLHDIPSQDSAILEITASQRDKSLLSLNTAGQIHLDHMTGERRLLELSQDAPVLHAQLARGGDHLAAMTAEGIIQVWKLHNPHPEATWRVLFGKVWYESYSQPEFVWQSSSASDDFEPKKSLIPLIFGSIKGTLYAMVFAVPLALLAALYTSQLTTPEIRGVVKPAVEIMAAIPSVIIGFLAALWFAPILERNLAAYFIGFGFLPAALLLSVIVWQGLRQWQPLRKLEMGYEFLVLIPILVLAGFICMKTGPVLEGALFGGDLKNWLYESAHIRYDQRNCIVIAFALGFAVIPIIFTIAEDAFSNVPRSLTAASLAVGASRWQTVWRVVLPSASPGVFAAMIIGFGRAVGETMIVLMATGNTPIMDISPFNGMRTLSANIAVEIPEAPFGGTLFRVLFMSAVVLLVMTAFLNTLAEIVRHRLRKKFGQFQ
jgi:phosphate transport system permease protein